MPLMTLATLLLRLMACTATAHFDEDTPTRFLSKSDTATPAAQLPTEEAGVRLLAEATCASYTCETKGWIKKTGVNSVTMPTEAKCCEDGVQSIAKQLSEMQSFLGEFPISVIQKISKQIAKFTIGGRWMKSMDLTSPRFCAKLNPKGDLCQDGWSCDSVEAAQAQLGTYWMPCGALTLKPNSDEDKRRLCRPENIITTEEECRAAAVQFRDEWALQLKSGFQRTVQTSDLKFRLWTIDQPPWKGHRDWTEYGFEPRYRDGAWHTGAHVNGNPDKPIGCSMDPNGNFVYWNPYLINEPEKWGEGARFTPLGGLIHAGENPSDRQIMPQIGICRREAVDLSSPWKAR